MALAVEKTSKCRCHHHLLSEPADCHHWSDFKVMTAVYYVWILVAWHIQQVKTHKPFDGLILSSLCVCVKTVITYDIIQLCRGRTGLIPGVGQRSSRCQTRISGRDAFLTYLQFRFEQSVFPAVPCFQFAVVLRFEPDQPTIRATCSSPCTKATQENRRRQDLHPSSSHKNLSSVCVCLGQEWPSDVVRWCLMANQVTTLPPKCPCYS